MLRCMLNPLEPDEAVASWYSARDRFNLRQLARSTAFAMEHKKCTLEMLDEVWQDLRLEFQHQTALLCESALCGAPHAYVQPKLKWHIKAWEGV